MAEAKKEEVKPKGPLGKIKEAMDDKEEQMAILSTFVRLGILIWAGGILTLNYVQFPGLSKQDNIDPTFIASVFTGVLATFGVEAGQRKNKSSASGGGASISKKATLRVTIPFHTHYFWIVCFVTYLISIMSNFCFI